MRATAAVRQRTDTENYSLPAQSTLRMAGITAVNQQSNLTPKVFDARKKTTPPRATSLEDGLWWLPPEEYGYG